jgi:DNA-directed RNA polymerase specialized sigma24 family protein
MSVEAAIHFLPGAYAAAIVLEREGLDHAGIGARLGIDPGAVGPLLSIAWAKLAALEAAEVEEREIR